MLNNKKHLSLVLLQVLKYQIREKQTNISTNLFVYNQKSNQSIDVNAMKHILIPKPNRIKI